MQPCFEKRPPPEYVCGYLYWSFPGCW